MERNNKICIYVSDEEMKEIELRATKCNLTIEEYVRACSLNIKPKQIPNIDITRFYHEICNLNNYANDQEVKALLFRIMIEFEKLFLDCEVK